MVLEMPVQPWHTSERKDYPDTIANMRDRMLSYLKELGLEEDNEMAEFISLDFFDYIRLTEDSRQLNTLRITELHQVLTRREDVYKMRAKLDYGIILTEKETTLLMEEMNATSKYIGEVLDEAARNGQEYINFDGNLRYLKDVTKVDGKYIWNKEGDAI